MRWVCPSQTLPLCLNHHVPMVLLWHKNLQYLCSRYLRFDHPLMPPHIWQPLLPNKVVQVVLWLGVITWLSYVWYHMYHLPPWNPKVRRVPYNNYIFNILYLPLQYKFLLYQGEGIIKCDRLAANTLKKCSLSFEERDPHHTLHWPLNSSVYLELYSELASSPTSSRKSSFLLMLVPITHW